MQHTLMGCQRFQQTIGISVKRLLRLGICYEDAGVNDEPWLGHHSSSLFRNQFYAALVALPFGRDLGS